MRRFDDNAPAFVIPKKPRLEATSSSGSFRHGPGESKKPSEPSSRYHHQQQLHRVDAKLNVWTGQLRFGDQVVESVDLYSPFRDGVKPTGFSTALEVQRMVHWKDCLKYPPVQELIKMTTASSALLLQKQFLSLKLGAKEGGNVQMSYLFLVNTFSPLFARICKDMRAAKLAALSVFTDGTVLLLIPEEAGPSVQLLFPIKSDGLTLHCLFIVPKRGAIGDSFDTIPRGPSAEERIDCCDQALLSQLELYRETCGLPLAPPKPKQVESLFTPSQPPPGGKPPTPYIPTPGYPTTSTAMMATGNRRPAMAGTTTPSNSTPSGVNAFNNRQQQQQQQQQQLHYNTPPAPPPPPPQASVNASDDLLSMLLAPPPPPPPPPADSKAFIHPGQSSSSKHASLAPKSSVERRQKNALFTNVFEQIRNVGKAPAKSIQQSAEVGGNAKLEAPSHQPVLIPTVGASSMDPRLARRMAQMGRSPTMMAKTPTSTTMPKLPNNMGMGSQSSPMSLPRINVKTEVKKVEPPQPVEQPPPKSQTEVVHDTAPMEIDDDEDDDGDEDGDGNDDDYGKQPYSPSQPILSSPSPSPEPMEIVVEERKQQTKKEAEQAERKQVETVQKKEEGNKEDEKDATGAGISSINGIPFSKVMEHLLNVQQQKASSMAARSMQKGREVNGGSEQQQQMKATEAAAAEPAEIEEQEDGGGGGDELSMDISNDDDLYDAALADSVSVGGTPEAERKFAAKAMNASSGFGFDYLDWNASPPRPKQQRTESSPSRKNSGSASSSSLSDIWGLKRRPSVDNDEQQVQPAEDNQQQQPGEQEDKDFRQLWADQGQQQQQSANAQDQQKRGQPPKVEGHKGTAVPFGIGTLLQPQQRNSSADEEVPPPPSAVAGTSKQQKPSLPSLMDLRLVAPPLALPKSPPIIPLHSAMASGIPSLVGPHHIHHRHKNGGQISAPQQQRPIHQVRPLFSVPPPPLLATNYRMHRLDMAPPRPVLPSPSVIGSDQLAVDPRMQKHLQHRQGSDRHQSGNGNGAAGNGGGGSGDLAANANPSNNNN